MRGPDRGLGVEYLDGTLSKVLKGVRGDVSKYLLTRLNLPIDFRQCHCALLSLVLLISMLLSMFPSPIQVCDRLTLRWNCTADGLGGIVVMPDVDKLFRIPLYLYVTYGQSAIMSHS